jgi:hypothetical protein
MTPPQNTPRKPNLLLGFPTALVFIALGYYLYFNVAERPNAHNVTFIKIVGAANMVFFGGLIIFLLIKKFRKLG